VRLGSSKGFTLIEMLIVVVIIGILAAIAVPRFSSAKGKAYDGTAKSDLRNAMTAQEAYYSDYQSFAASASDLIVTASSNVSITVTAGDASGYEMTAKHALSANTWCVNSDGGDIQLATDC
jgi:prepilin-type N-terminal cleavage/methylation domain-containing protein